MLSAFVERDCHPDGRISSPSDGEDLHFSPGCRTLYRIVVSGPIFAAAFEKVPKLTGELHILLWESRNTGLRLVFHSVSESGTSRATSSTAHRQAERRLAGS